MKTITILLMILTVGLLISGCSKTAATKETVPKAPVTSNPSDGTVDISVDTSTQNPDIGTLDDTNVSDSLPQ